MCKLIDGECKKFTASEGWKWRFFRRHGIHQLSVVGENQAADNEAADTFVDSFREYIQKKKFSLNQFFDGGKTG